MACVALVKIIFNLYLHFTLTVIVISHMNWGRPKLVMSIPYPIGFDNESKQTAYES